MDDDKTTPRRSGRIWAGLFLVLVGAVLVLDQMGFPLPYWLFSWHAFLIALGLFIGFRHGFRGGFWLILILIGIMFVLNPSRHGYDRWHDGEWKSHWHDKEWKARWKAQWKNDRHLRKW